MFIENFDLLAPRPVPDDWQPPREWTLSIADKSFVLDFEAVGNDAAKDIVASTRGVMMAAELACSVGWSDLGSLQEQLQQQLEMLAERYPRLEVKRQEVDQDSSERDMSIMLRESNTVQVTVSGSDKIL
ncbi:hypothetical protein [Mitsuaria sp. 7]|uniref:hypothetical protein n=1 Tax=Mitsuaria sp. 7 TaxID=1658665 RepID=UPI0007DCCBD8|nr:hypothetical protein [Mitsuaria sp. 7]ANH68885.1 hypothetical protein ABE85_17260 [Mitsuaria sp. 7]